MSNGNSVFPSLKLGIFLFFVPIMLIPQPSIGQKLDSLVTELPVLKGQNRIDALNFLTQEYAYINMDSARMYLQMLVDYAEQIDDGRALAVAALLKGNFLYDDGQYDLAQKYNREGLTKSISIQDTSVIARSYLNIGATADAAGLKDSAIINYLNAIKFFEYLNDTLNSAYLKINIGLVFKSMSEFPKALDYYKKAYRDLSLLKDDFGITTISTNLASLYIEMQEYDSATYYGNKGLEGYRNLGFTAYAMYPLEVLAKSNFHLKNYSLSEKQFLEAFELSLANQLEEETFTISLGLSNLYLAQAKLQLAKEYAQKAFVLARKTGSLEDLAEVNKMLYRITKNAQRYAESMAYLEASQQYHDSVQGIQKVQVIADLETKYQTAKKEQEIAHQKLDIAAKESAIKSQRMQIFGLISSLFILSLFAFIFYNQYRNKQKQKMQKALFEEKSKGFEAVINATEEERSRISKDLHDGIGQQLSALKMSLNNVSQQITDETQRKNLQVISEQFSSSADEVRQISHQMMPRKLLENGLVEAIEDLLSSSFQFSKITYHFEHHKVSNRFNQRIEISLYRVLQELVNNIIKHADATEVAVQLIRNKDALLLFAEDNGKGMPESSSKGHGLLNIRSRLDMVKGSVNFEPSPNSGTSVSIKIPLE